ncbi:hypothetical protein [Streptomyces lavendofoliae]|uniref:hypothetical protein n=1 Tax=Streptomyces lavendofoliae TaxID=67314 RepID=UPI003D8BF82C
MREAGPTTGREMAAAVNEVEGYLLYQAELRTARTEAEAFARRLTWLTTAQQEEVARVYAADRMRVSEMALRAIAARCEELRAEYTARYAHLRRRLLCLHVATVSAAVSLGAASWIIR